MESDFCPLAHFFSYVNVIKSLIKIKEFANKSGQMGLSVFSEFLAE